MLPLPLNFISGSTRSMTASTFSSSMSIYRKK